jgi:predicted RNase H-like HicB family nuclease
VGGSEVTERLGEERVPGMDVTAVCVREGRWWAVEIPEVKGAYTQAKSLDHVPMMVADAVSLLTGVPADEVRVTIRRPRQH